MEQLWQQIEDYVESRELRERVLLLVMALGLLVGIFYGLLMKPLLDQQSNARAGIVRVKNQITTDRALTIAVQQQLSTGVFTEQQNQLKDLRLQLDEIDGQLKDKVGSLIEPELMADVLEEILLKTEGMQLLSLRNDPVESLMVPTEAEQEVDGQLPGLYRHGVRMRLTGGYMASIKYLQALESLPWQLYWNNLDYQVDEYPGATITLDVHTVSLSEDWIGV